MIICEAFDLDRVAGGVAEEHCPLLAGLAFEPHRGCYDEIGLPIF
jgi:hypothetical protein